MLECQRRAVDAVLRVLEGHSLTETLGTLWLRQPSLNPAQRGFIQDVSFGVLRHLGTLRSMLEELLDRPLREREVEGMLLVALYQLRWTRTAPHAVVDHAVDLCAAFRKVSAKGLVNALLRSYLRQAESLHKQASRSDIGRFSYQQWWIDAIRQAYASCYQQLLDTGNERPPMTLRVNVRAGSIEHYLRSLEETNLPARTLGDCGLMLNKPVAISTLPGFSSGRVSVQDWAAQQATRLLELKNGLSVLDACAAPGGKTAHILESSDARVTALEVDASRLERMRGNLERLGLSARLVCADAADLARWWDGEPFQRVLLDVPCSASGIVRRHPDIKWLRRPTDIPQFVSAQRRLLDALWKPLARGGKLLYATCSIFPEENQLQVAAFLTTHNDARLIPLSNPENLSSAKPSVDDDGVSRVQEVLDRSLQFIPDPRHDGFFYALLEKV